MCDINCIWLFNLLVAFVLIIQQQQHVVVCSIQQREQQQQQHQQQHLHSLRSPSTSTSLSSSYDDIRSYASALAAKYLHQHSLPKVNVVKREIKNDKNTDFISYLSDFNMQDETSIPEDIFDQRHLREIEEKERKVGKKTLGVATDVADGDDVIDVNLPYDDADADADAEADADIILESQRSIERNFSNDDVSNYNKHKSYNRDVDRNVGEVVVGVRADTGTGTDDMAEVRPKDNSEGLTAADVKKQDIYKNDLIVKEKIKLNFVRSSDKKRQQEKEIKYENYIGSTSTHQRQYTYDQQLPQQDLTKDKIDEDNYYDGIIDDEEDDDDGSAEYERFKLMHEQKQKEQQLQKERETLEQELEKKRQQLKHQDKMRQQHQRELDSQQQLQNYHMSSWKKSNEGKLSKAFPNDNVETMMANMDNYADQGDNDADNNKNNDKSEDIQNPLQQKEQQQQKQQDAIGDIDDEQQYQETDSILKESKNPVEKKDYTNVFIPRKMKRHNGAARLDDATNRYSRIKKQQHQQQEQHQQHQHHQHQQSKSQNSNEKDDDSYAVDNQDEYMPHFGIQQGESFKKSYYGIVNGNSTRIDDSNQLKHNSGVRKDSDELHADADGKDVATIKTTPTLRDGYKGETLFEKEKSLRRNNKHYGHKTHKKKYKDYVRYSSLMMIRAPTTSSTEMVEATATTTTPATFSVVTSAPTTTTRVVKLDHPNSEDILRFHKDNYEKKLKMDRIKGIALPASPIFVLKAKNLESHEKLNQHHSAVKPFYEGQINYYLETDDDDDSLGGHGSEARFITKGDRMDTNDWYRKLSPVLRNGVKTGNNNNDKDDRVAVTGVTNTVGVGGTGSGSANGAATVSGGYTPYHHYRNHHQRSQHHHHNSHHHNQKHHQHSRHHAYQRKMLPKKIMVTTTPLPPPSRRQETNSPIQELAHQITDVKEFERYYAKWPHLARVQSQLHDEQLREQLELQNLQQQQLGNYQDYEYDEDYFEALQSGNVEDNVPPYIRKYNRRNKQLLDLLEGTLPPPTRPPQQLRWSGSKLQPGPRDSSVGSMSVRIDDDYLKEKRKRYHQKQKQIHDLFEQQRTITTTMAPTTIPNETINEKVESNNHYENHLPDEDISISLETQEHDENEPHNWQTVKGSKSLASSSIPGKSEMPWQREKLIITSSTTATGYTADAATAPVPTLKPALYKLPSYPSIAGSFMQRPRSRSAQFAPSSGSDYRRATPLQFNSGANSFINAGGFVAFNGAMAKNNAQQHNNGKSMTARFSANNEENNKGSTPNPEITNTSKNNNNNQHDSSGASSGSGSISSSSQLSSYSSPSSSLSSSPASVSNSFVYHRVIDASPRFVGAGLTGRKQRLPFVAITDRRLETSKKSLTDHPKDFEQNHYPMP